MLEWMPGRRIPDQRDGSSPRGSLSAQARHVWVLSGGGVRGAAQVGAMQALLAAGVCPDGLVGCSVGALNAAFMAGAPDAARADDLADRWLAITRQDVFGGTRISTVRNLITRQSAVLSNAPLRRLIRAWAPADTFEGLAVPLRVVTTSLTDGRAVYHRCGALAPVLLASAALPGIFPPVRLVDPAARMRPGQGDLHVDGGITDLVPVSGALELAPTDVWVLDVGAAAGIGSWHPRSALDVLLASLRTAMRARPVPHMPGVRLHHISLHGEAGGPGAMADFGQTRDLLAAGREAARQTLLARAALGGHPRTLPADALGMGRARTAA